MQLMSKKCLNSLITRNNHTAFINPNVLNIAHVAQKMRIRKLNQTFKSYVTPPPPEKKNNLSNSTKF